MENGKLYQSVTREIPTEASIHMRRARRRRVAAPLCHNGAWPAAVNSGGVTAMLNVDMTQGKRILVWLMLAALAALVTYLAFRAYLSPELLLNFSNTFSC